jgi:hypothetical protein
MHPTWEGPPSIQPYRRSNSFLSLPQLPGAFTSQSPFSFSSEALSSASPSGSESSSKSAISCNCSLTFCVQCSATEISSPHFVTNSFEALSLYSKSTVVEVAATTTTICLPLPLPLSQKLEMDSDFVASLIQNEVKYFRPVPLLFRSAADPSIGKSKLDMHLRGDCLDWMHSTILKSRAVVKKMNGVDPGGNFAYDDINRPQVFFIAASLFDRFVASTHYISPKKFLFVAASTLWIASKLEDLVPLSASFLAKQLPATSISVSSIKKLVSFQLSSLAKSDVFISWWNSKA